MTAPLLLVEGLTRRFGGLIAASDVSFAVAPGEIFGIIGPNGAGKTTLFNVIAGHYRPTSGRVAFEGTDISGHASDEVGRRGIARTFQAVHVFKNETVRANLHRAAILARRHNPLAWLSRHPHATPDLEGTAAFLGLDKLLDNVAGSLAYGLQKTVGVGLAMMVGPKLMLMDEPAAGLNPSEKIAAAALIRRLRDERGISVLLVEHDMPLVMGICDRILVLNQGIPIALGTPAEVKSNQAVIDAYLGEDYEFA
ncbi:MAG: ABC transporter ATP-binding protein [Rhodospirillales bacterium]|nr:ABC transporter ATP-binding protein [Rhodospirillales bacterium]MDE2200982.1 ABC transporter ATP-binding protein [Rhodospirillales bacterium]